MTSSFVMGHIKRADTNLLIVCVVIFVVFSLVAAIAYLVCGLFMPYYVCLSIALLVIVFCTVAYTNRVGNLKQRPTYKTLARFGSFDSIRTQIDAEAISNQSVAKGNYRFTQNWILYPYFGGLHVVHRPTLVWAHAKHLATRHSVNFIPTGTTHTYSVLIHYTEPAKRQGFITVHSLEIKTPSEAASRDLLQHVLVYAPWVIAGYTPEIARLWRTQTSEMIAAVKSRYNSS